MRTCGKLSLQVKFQQVVWFGAESAKPEVPHAHGVALPSHADSCSSFKFGNFFFT